MASILGLSAATAGEAAAEQPAVGGAFNLRIVSDSVPDWSSRDNFVRSALSGWETNQDKLCAQFRWSYRCRRVGPQYMQDGRSVLDPILFFNSYGMTFCGQISAMNVALWEAAGYDGRVVDVNIHVVAEVFYDGRWHMFDNDFCNYFLDAHGVVVGCRELHTGHDRQADGFWLFDHSPHASGPGGRIFMGPSSWTLEGVADWHTVSEVRPASRCGHAGQRYVLGVRPNERYTRLWEPLGTGSAYARPLQSGLDAVQASPKGSTLLNSRANGRWHWQPDLSDASVLHASANVAHCAEGLRAVDAEQTAEAVFSVTAGNVVTSIRIEAKADADVRFSVSGNGGVTWVALQRPAARTAEWTHAGEPLAGCVAYLLKAEWKGVGALRSLALTTITQVNQRVLPALRLGRNEIAVVSDEHLEYQVLNPRLSARDLTQECYLAKGWQTLQAPIDHEPTLRSLGPAELVLRCATPRAIRHIRMACTAILAEPSPDAILDLEVSCDAGRTWQSIQQAAWSGAPYDRRLAADLKEIPDGTREAWLRYRAHRAGIGLINLVAEVGYAPALPRGAVDVAYAWEEYRAGAWVSRTHTERIASARRRYAITVGGSRPPRMRSITVGPAEPSLTAGYGDALEPTPERLPSDFVWRLGERIATGCPYTVNRPASNAFPDPDGKLLTDGYIGLASFWGLDKIVLAGEKNAARVGELAVWPAGDELIVTIDLGRERNVGGAVVCAVQPNAGVLYPATMRIECSRDGQTFAAAGSATWEDCFFPAADEFHWEGADSPLYAALPAGGILDFKFRIPCAEPQPARYVRFRMAPPAGQAQAGIGLWELDVFDRMEKLPRRERIVLPETD
jgi:hypothetical protein